MSYINYEIFEEKLIYHFENYNIECNAEAAKNFYGFYRRVITENQKYNLTSVTDADEFILKHFADSVMPLKYFGIFSGAKIIDIGTGAGFPALPMYIVRRDLNITFLDSSAKKINFIKDAVSAVSPAGGGKAEFICGRAEDTAKAADFRAAHDFAVSRAVARLNILCELAAPLIRTGGSFISYKSKNAEAEISEAKNAVKILGLEIAGIQKFNIGDAERVLINIKKIKDTDSIYPRSFGKIIKKPL
jgi:16S rRNA (guanine527-N7)-methyltransferase